MYIHVKTHCWNGHGCLIIPRGTSRSIKSWKKYIVYRLAAREVDEPRNIVNMDPGTPPVSLLVLDGLSDGCIWGWYLFY